MKRIDTSTRAINLFGAGKDGFKDGDLANGIVPTDFNASWPNMIQEEIANVIEDLGIVLDPSSRTQLREALAGRLLDVRTFTTSQTYVMTPGTKWIEVELIGGGGGGAATPATNASQLAGAGGGASGSWARALYASGFNFATITIGAGGASAAPGGQSSFGAGLLICPGGGTSNARLLPNTTVFAATQQGAPGALPTGSGIIFAAGGSIGTPSMFGVEGGGSGAGGNSPYGSGGTAIGTGSGGAGRGFGSGGAGAGAGPSQPGYSGGAGAPGLCIIREYA